MSSRRQRIIEMLVQRLRTIQATSGYETDAGLYLYWGPVVLGPDDPPMAIAVVPGTTETNPLQAGKKIITLPIEFHAVVREDTPQRGTMENSWAQAEAILSDIKRAVEVDDPEFDRLVVDFTAGEVSPLVRQEGGEILGLRIEYRVVYAETWGNPEA
jgi:hypothetical protein